MEDLDQIRKEINSIDDQILQLLSDRRRIATRVIRLKERTQKPLRDSHRERDLLGRLITAGRQLGLDAHFVTEVFHEIIDDSVRFQERYLLHQGNEKETQARRVAFQGIEGAYSHLAAQKFFANWKGETTCAGYPTFDEVVAAVQRGDVECAVLPIENTTAGSINEVYDLLSQADLTIIGEEVFRVEHCLLALEDVPATNIRRVLSHPQGILQCMKFLSKLSNCQREYYTDTAMAVQKVKEDNDLSQAAIASREAGERYGLKVVAQNIADQRDNFTRFLVIAREPRKVDSRIPAKTSLVIATSHEEGALLRALAFLYEHRISLTKLESRPRPGMPFQYLFYLDFEGHIEDDNVRAAIEQLRGVTTHLKILGSYPSQGRSRTAPDPATILPPRSKDSARAASHVASPKGAGEAKGAAGPRPHPKKGGASRPGGGTFKLASRDSRAGDSVLDIRGVRIGGAELVVIAGPHAVESPEQILACAHEVKERGGKILRGGGFRHVTSPASFAGLGIAGVEMLAEAGRRYGLPVLTEVGSPEEVEAAAPLADILMVGSRNMQNFKLLREVGHVNIPVLLKRGVSASIEELLDAAEFVLRQGNQQLMLCERGVRTFETSARNTLDLAAVPALKARTHLPIVVDPSPAAVEQDLVRPLAMAARAVAPHGIMLPIHPDPDAALGSGDGGPPALDFTEFADLTHDLLSAAAEGK